MIIRKTKSIDDFTSGDMVMRMKPAEKTDIESPDSLAEAFINEPLKYIGHDENTIYLECIKTDRFGIYKKGNTVELERPEFDKGWIKIPKHKSKSKEDIIRGSYNDNLSLEYRSN